MEMLYLEILIKMGVMYIPDYNRFDRIVSDKNEKNAAN